MSSSRKKPARIALALAGGGPLGAIYEIGALCALDESLDGINFSKLDHYVGVSAGGFIAAALANGMTPRELCASFIENGAQASEVFDPSWLMVPAYGEFARRAIMAPGLAASALWRFASGRTSLTSALERLGPGLPTGIFSNDGSTASWPACSPNAKAAPMTFRKLRTKLTLVATNLDSGEAAPFGRPAGTMCPSRARAGQLCPARPVPAGRDRRQLLRGRRAQENHACVGGHGRRHGPDAVPEPAGALQCHGAPDSQRVMQRGLPLEKRSIPRIVDGGLPAVLSQTFRSMIHSRMELGMKHYERAYPDTDIVLIEPDHRDPELYLANTFSYGQRRTLAEHAYQQTRQMLRSRKTSLSAKLARHGVSLRAEVLDDPRHHLVTPPAAPTRIGRAIASLQEVMDDLGHVVAPQAPARAKHDQAHRTHPWSRKRPAAPPSASWPHAGAVQPLWRAQRLHHADLGRAEHQPRQPVLPLPGQGRADQHCLTATSAR
jgi:NTE family protein